ncbi:NAD(P)-dependent alcohol dehydrogenase [Microbacterium sp. 2FI]|uniref:NAD(P)-dependent alcohol dehydrogenase n=1 Tax=Microbacterium sp. 2FI TaxID=2502193 RepID=UPI0010F7FD40|nr:NAD(P)-dependent alcohol dehydrogenase [Microbacterium sp. 2FI]
MTTTTAAVLREPDGPFLLEAVTLPDLGPRDVLVRLVGVGFCHTDVTPRDLAAYVLPAILGHEGSGIVTQVGAGVDSVRVGDSVVLSFASCGRCAHCLGGQPAYCDEFMALNLAGRDLQDGTEVIDSAGEPVGGRWFGQSSFAQYAIAKERSVVVVDPKLPLELMGPLGCGIMTGAGAVLNEMKLAPGQSVVVFGAGAVGLSAVMAAKLAGATDIVAVDLHQSRLDLAVELGATRTVLASARNLDDKVRGDSDGLDFALDTTARESIMSLAIDVVRTGGKIVLVGAGSDSVTVFPTQLVGKHLTYVFEGSSDPQVFIPTLIEHWRDGRFPFDRLVTTYPFEDINTAEADSRSGQAIKPVLLFR